MAETLYKDTTYTVSLLVQSIGLGKVALPDIHLQFVWQASKVRARCSTRCTRDFRSATCSSGETGADAGARQIGVDTKAAVPNHLIVDGQQRLTSLFAVMTGATVLRDDYCRTPIRIAFRPSDAMFAVTNAAIEKDPEFIAGISALRQQGAVQLVHPLSIRAIGCWSVPACARSSATATISTRASGTRSPCRPGRRTGRTASSSSGTSTRSSRPPDRTGECGLPA